jgi:hypothetical protein
MTNTKDPLAVAIEALKSAQSELRDHYHDHPVHVQIREAIEAPSQPAQADTAQERNIIALAKRVVSWLDHADFVAPDCSQYGSMRQHMNALREALIIPAKQAQAEQPQDARQCYSCGKPAHMHPMVDDPRGGQRRGPCPSEQLQAQDEREAFNKWFSIRDVWPRLTYEECFIAGYRAAQEKEPTK